MSARRWINLLLCASFLGACATAIPEAVGPQAALKTARSYVAAGRLAEAELLLTTRANGPEMQNQRDRILGTIALRRGQGRDALEYLEPLAKAYGEDAGFGWDLAQAYILSGRTRQAWTELQRCTTKVTASERPDIWLAAGEIALELSQLAPAKEIYGGILKAQPDHEAAFVGLTRSVAMSGDLGPAIESLKERVLSHPEHMEVRFLLGSLYVTANQLPEALAALNEVVTLSVDHLEARRALGFIQLRTGRYEEAEQNLRIVAASLQNDPATENNLGSALVGLKRFEEAETWVKKAIQSAPQQPILWQNLLVVHVAAGRADRAANVFGTISAKILSGDPALESYGERARLLSLMTALICSGAIDRREMSGTLRKLHTTWKQRGYGTLKSSRLKRWIKDTGFGPDLALSLEHCPTTNQP